MQLTDDELGQYRTEGYLFLPGLLADAEVEPLVADLPDLVDRSLPGMVMERDDRTVRMVHGVHQESDAFARIATHPDLVEPVEQMLGSRVYIHQFKVNMKAAFDGEIWQWHQDYPYLHQDDGIPTPRMANAIVFLDEVNEFNGPLLLIPGSHVHGDLSTPSHHEQAETYDGAETWIDAMTTQLKLTVPRDEVARLADRHGIVGPKGPAGSVLFFHPDVVHGSGTNMTAHDRRIIVINFNSVENTPITPDEPRPGFLANPDFTPLQAWAKA